MAATIGEILERIEASGILDEESLAAVRAKAGHPDADATEFVKRLHRDGDVTGYQAQALWKDRGHTLRLGNYVVEDELGRGGMGVVLKARHKRMQRTVAVKVLPAKMTEDGEAIARFQREVVAASQLMHANIVAAYDADEVDGQHILVMEFVDGRDLSAVVKKKGPLSVDQAIDCVTQAARGLEFAHAKGVVHRDIKPANLLLDADGVVKILDLGLARFSDASEVGTQAELTGTGTIMGTVDYMSPEQAMSTRSADERADVYSLGCTLHYLLTAKPTFGGDTLMARMMAHANSSLPSISAVRTDVPPGLDDVFRRMIAKDPGDRLQTMTEVVAALEGCRTDPSGTIVTATAKGSDDSTRSGDNLSGFLRSLDADEVSDQVSPSTAGAATAAASAAVAENVDTDSQTVVSKPTSGTIRTRGERSRTQSIVRNLPDWTRDWRVLAGAGGGIVLVLAALLWPGSREDVPATAGPSNPGVEWDDEPAPDGGGGANRLAADDGWRPIFNRENLDGWEVFGGEPGDWAIVDDVLTTTKMSRLIYTRETFDDVAVRVECRLFDRMNSGVALRASRTADQTDGYEAQLAYADSPGIRDGSRTILTGGLWGIAPFDKPLVSPGEWFTLEFSAVGDRHVVKVNGRTTVDVVDGARASGYVALANFLDTGTRAVEFRRIEIREINASRTTPLAPRFALEFDGKDDRVDLPFGYDGSHPLTIETWVSIQPSKQQQLVCCAEQAGAALEISNDGHPRFSFHDGADYAAVVSSSPVNRSELIHLAAVFDGKAIRLYRNGRLDGQPAKIDGVHEASKQLFRIGANPEYLNNTRYVQHLSGRMQALRISRVPRYAADFEPDVRLESDADTLALYLFDEGQGDVLVDASGNGHHGKIVGAKWVRVGGPALAQREFGEFDPDGPVQVFVLFGDQAMLGNPKVQPNLQAALRDSYPFLVGENGQWETRDDVRHVQVHFVRGAMTTERKEWLTMAGKLGPEVGFGHVVGDAIDAPVLLLKSCTGNRSLGWDLLPPGSDSFEVGGKVFAGYKDSPAEWDKGTTPEPIAWYAGKQYDDDIASAKAVLAKLEEYHPKAADRGYEIAGFVFWQGHRDRLSKPYSQRYEQNLVRFIDAVRRDFDAPDAKFVMATFAPSSPRLDRNSRAIVDAQLAVGGQTGKYPRFEGNVKTIDVRPVWPNPDVPIATLASQLYANPRLNLDVGTALGRAMIGLLDQEESALLFEGNGFVDVPTLRLGGPTPFTVEAEVRAITTEQGMVVCDAEFGGFALKVDKGRWTFDGYRLEEGRFGITAERPAATGRWTHLAAVYDGKVARLFVDGQPQGAPLPLDGIKSSRLPVRLGANPEKDQARVRDGLRGSLRNVRFSKVARYEKAFTPPPRHGTDADTLALFRLDEGRGDVAHDASGNGHDGKIVGGEWVRRD